MTGCGLTDQLLIALAVVTAVGYVGMYYLGKQSAEMARYYKDSLRGGKL